MGGPYTATSLYGAPPVQEATPVATPTHTPGSPEPTRRVAAPSGLLGNPTALLVLLVGGAILLHMVSFSGSLSLEA